MESPGEAFIKQLEIYCNIVEYVCFDIYLISVQLPWNVMKRNKPIFLFIYSEPDEFPFDLTPKIVRYFECSIVLSGLIGKVIQDVQCQPTNSTYLPVISFIILFHPSNFDLFADYKNRNRAIKHLNWSWSLNVSWMFAYPIEYCRRWTADDSCNLTLRNDICVRGKGTLAYAASDKVFKES